MKEQHRFAKELSDSQSSRERPNSPISSALQRFGNYDLVQRIGIGGMGEVYLARQRTAFGREVAVKIIRSDLMHDITIRKRFLREAEVNAYLKHDHILPLVEFGEENGRLFLVTPYITGGTLSKRLRDNALSLAETHQLFTALVEAVAYLHKRGVIHRDLKPSNILLDHEEGSQRIYVRLIDFGIASLQGQTASAPLTTAGNEMGTAAYMAPERLSGIAAPSNDIYSLGIILYQMLTGTLPDNDIESMLPEPLIEVVQQSTAPDPNERYGRAEELLKGFEHAYQSLSLSHFRVTGSNPAHPPLGQTISARIPSATPQRQAPSSTPITPMSNGAASALPRTASTPNIPPMRNTFNPTNIQNTSTNTKQSKIGDSLAQIPLEEINIAEPNSYPSQLSHPVRLRSEVVLPPLPDRTSPFKGEDYNAPTSYLAPKPLQKSSTASDSTTRIGQESKVAPPPNRKKRSTPTITIISVIIIVVFFVIGGLGYSIYQSFDTATVTVMPQVQTVNTILNLTANPNQTNVDSNAGIIPAATISSTKSASKSGTTTGQGDCKVTALPPFVECQQAVGQQDVNSLERQLLTSLQPQIAQDIAQQEQTQGATPLGNISYPKTTNAGTDNPTATENPPVGTVSNTVTVTMSLEGTQEYIKNADINTVASQKLQGQLKQNYALMDGTLKIGQPVVESQDRQGNMKIKVAVASAASYQMTPNDIATIQNHIAGKSKDDAHAFIAQYPNLDPNNVSIQVNLGGNLPGTGTQITIKEVKPNSIPTVQVPAVP